MFEIQRWGTGLEAGVTEGTKARRFFLGKQALSQKTLLERLSRVRICVKLREDIWRGEESTCPVLPNLPVHWAKPAVTSHKADQDIRLKRQIGIVGEEKWER